MCLCWDGTGGGLRQFHHRLTCECHATTRRETSSKANQRAAPPPRTKQIRLLAGKREERLIRTARRKEVKSEAVELTGSGGVEDGERRPTPARLAWREFCMDQTKQGNQLLICILKNK